MSVTLTNLAKPNEKAPMAGIACWNLGFCGHPAAKIGLIATNFLTFAKPPRGCSDRRHPDSGCFGIAAIVTILQQTCGGRRQRTTARREPGSLPGRLPKR
jgi:hypothetical protein